MKFDVEEPTVGAIFLAQFYLDWSKGTWRHGPQETVNRMNFGNNLATLGRIS